MDVLHGGATLQNDDRWVKIRLALISLLIAIALWAAIHWPEVVR